MPYINDRFAIDRFYDVRDQTLRTAWVFQIYNSARSQLEFRGAENSGFSARQPGTASEQPEVKVNLLNVCMPSAEEQKEIAAALAKISAEAKAAFPPGSKMRRPITPQR